MKPVPALDTVAVGDALEVRAFEPTNVSLFLYNAAIWNSHRIHYDERYATDVEVLTLMTNAGIDVFAGDFFYGFLAR